MTMYYFIYALVLCGVPISLIDNEKMRRLLQVGFFIIALSFLVLFAGLRPNNIDRDYQNYADWFNRIAIGTATNQDFSEDPAFFLISLLAIYSGLKFTAVALIYAALSFVAILYFAATAVSNRWMTLYFYLLFCDYFTIGIMTEIRAMAAIPLMAISLYFACSGYRRRSILVFCAALAFHLSVIVALPILILILFGVKFYSRVWAISLALLTYIAVEFFDKIVEFMSGSARIARALDVNSINDMSRLSWTASVHLITIVISVTVWRKLSLHQRVAVLCSGVGLSLMLIFLPFTGLGYRFYYIFDLYWVLQLVVFMELSRGHKRLTYAALLIILGFAVYSKSLENLVLLKWM
jgi:hypothetical protein